jgi:hypothetical protein
MAAYGSWVPYSGVSALVLAVVLLAIVALLAYLGKRLSAPVTVERPGKAVSYFMIVIWILSIWTCLIAFYAYGVQLYEVHLFARPPVNRIAPITVLTAAATFFTILCMTKTFGWKVALGSAFVGAAVGPMVFELPFDLIVIGRTVPSVPPSPTLYRMLFFFPLFITEISTIALLTLLPSMKISKYTLYSLAGMSFVFAVWAVFGFHYPNEPIPYALNAISKVLSFVSVVTLFL